MTKKRASTSKARTTRRSGASQSNSRRRASSTGVPASSPSGREDTYTDRNLTPERVQEAIDRENQRRYWSGDFKDYSPVASAAEVVEAIERQRLEDEWANDRR